MTKKNVYQRINAVMAECEYIQKVQAQQGKGVRYDEVIAMLRPLLIKHGLVIQMNQLEFSEGVQVEGTKQKVFTGQYSMKIINIDDPSEVVEHTAYAQGMDGGDKACGKAHTYAAKIMLVKGFGIETGEDEESRAERIEKTKTINDETIKKIAALIDGDEALWSMICSAYKISHLAQVPEVKEAEIVNRINNYKAKKNASD